MRLYVNGQDIHRLVLADLDDELSVFVHEGEPDTFLGAMNSFLNARGKKIKDLAEVYAVVGPGSATSLRTVVTILNVLAFAHKFSLFGLTKEKDEQDIGSVRAINEGTVSFVQKENRLSPVYENAPKITESTRDALKRKK